MGNTNFHKLAIILFLGNPNRKPKYSELRQILMNFKFLADSPWKKRRDSLGDGPTPTKLFKSPRSKAQNHPDRFIPCRIHDSLAGLLMQPQDDANQFLHPSSFQNTEQLQKEEPNPYNHYSALLEAQLISEFDASSNEVKEKFSTTNASHKSNPNILKYKKSKRSVSVNPIHTYSPFQNSSFDGNRVSKQRKVSKLPYKILDAPSLVDDYYLNLLDWSSTNNVSIGLDNTVYIWSASTNKVYKVHEVPQTSSISSVAWNESSTYLSIGENDGRIKIYDVEACKIVRDVGGHASRAGSLAWNGNLLGSRSRDRSILVRDLRCPETYLSKFVGHRQEICGLKWSPDQKYIASGGNDNKIIVWDTKVQGEMVRFSEHQAAVKALAWNPDAPNILASGGGKSDRCIKFWNMHTNKRLASFDTGSQVCNMMFSKNSKELVSTHGYSLNEIIVWNYPTMEKVASLTGHSSRVLYLGMSPDGENIVTGAGDETLRFWNVFPPQSKVNSDIFDHSAVFPSGIDLR